jgi:hypothetical protein
MYTAYTHIATRTSKAGFIWFIPVYCLLIAGAYILSGSFFQAVIESDKIFGYALSKEVIFNQTLFIHLLAGIMFIAAAHLVSRLMNVSISKGNILLAILLVMTIFCFIIGINISLLHTTKFWIIKEHLSLMQLLQNLKLKGELQLYWIMFLFTFVLPSLKMIAMAYDIFISKADGRKNFLLSLLSKWAMLDILVVGIIISTMKSGSGFAEMTTGYGLTFFITSVILSMIISICLPYTKNN